MTEHVARVVYYLGVHLLYASTVWVAAWILTATVRGSATTKYWIWVATSLNFILPLGAAVDKFGASHLSWARPLGVIGDAGVGIARNAVAVAVVWSLGATLMLTRLCLRLRAERRRNQPTSGQPAHDPKTRLLARGVPVSFAGSCQGPAVDGVLRTRIWLPRGIDQLLTERELNAVLIHELRHAQRRDNLIRLIHEMGLCVLWFHPLVWISGARLGLYRELSCDESVIQSAHGRDLVSALAKLANPQETQLLQASASSFLSRRLARLAAHPQPTSRAMSTVLMVLFGAVLMGGVFETVAHTACCFLSQR